MAYPSLTARVFAAVAVTIYCLRKENSIYYRSQWVFHWNQELLKRILGIAVPNGIEQGHGAGRILFP